MSQDNTSETMCNEDQWALSQLLSDTLILSSLIFRSSMSISLDSVSKLLDFLQQTPIIVQNIINPPRVQFGIVTVRHYATVRKILR